MRNGMPSAPILIVVLLLLQVASTESAAATFYVDPNFTASGRDGSASRPWQWLGDSGAWSVINNSLATGPVTVYFSARNAFADSNQASTVGISLLRTSGSAHRLTLDGMSKYNTNDSSPLWADYAGTAKFTITGSYPLNSDNSSAPYADRNYITIRGFKLVATDGQIAQLTAMDDLVFELNDCSHTGAPTTGPGIVIGRPQETNGSWSSRVIIRNNLIYRTRGEGIYIGGSTPDPPGAGTTATGDDILVAGNTIIDAGWYGGEGDGIDVKDGNTNVRIVGNTIYHSPGWTPPELSIDGIVVESADLIERNFIHGYRVSGVTTSGAWNNSLGRDRLVIRNNILVNNLLAAIRLYGGRPGFGWSNTQVHNNTMYRGEFGILIPEDGNIHDRLSILNNIAWDMAKYALDSAPGVVTTSDYNTFYKSAGGFVVRIGGSYYSAVNLINLEPHSLSVDPQVMSVSTPYTPDGFRLQSTSPLTSRGLRLTSFNYDYFGDPRGELWDPGAARAAAGNGAPQPPTNLRIVPSQ